MNNSVDRYRQPIGTALTVVPQTMPSSTPDRVDLRFLTALFRRRLKLFLAVFALVFAAGLAFTFLKTPVYTSESQVALNPRVDDVAPSSPTDQRQQDTSSAPSDSWVDTQTTIIASQKMAEQVALGLNLAADPRYAKPAPPSGLIHKLAALFRPDAPTGPLTKEEALENAVDDLVNNVTAERVSSTYAVNIDFSNTDPDFSARVVNEYARQYTEGALQAKQGQTREVNKLLADRLDTLRSKADADAYAVGQYKIAHGLLNTTGSTLTEQELSNDNQAIGSARADAAETAARLATAEAQLKRGSAGDDVGASLESPVVSSLRQEQAQAMSNVAQLTANYGPRYPDVVKAKGELDAINRQIEAEIRRVISNLTAKNAVAQERLNSLTGTASQARGTLAQNNEALVGLTALQKRADASQSTYLAYLNRYNDLSASEGTEQPETRVLALADTPDSPSSPKVVLYLALSLAIGLLLALASAFVAELAFSGLTTGDDVEERLGVRYLGTIPLLRSVTKSGGLKPISAIIEEPRSAFAESLRSLRASITYSARGNAKVIAVTSALASEGKTTTCICLARSMAQTGEKVLLVDCDLRRQGVSRFLRPEEADRPGLMEVLRGEADVGEALIKDGATGLFVLPVSRHAELEAELLAGQEMGRLLEALREGFDTIILDTAPILAIADARLVLGLADLTVFVVRWRKTPDHAVRSALRMLPGERVDLAGVVLTRVDMRKQKNFGYGDSGFYHGQLEGYYS